MARVILPLLLSMAALDGVTARVEYGSLDDASFNAKASECAAQMKKTLATEMTKSDCPFVAIHCRVVPHGTNGVHMHLNCVPSKVEDQSFPKEKDMTTILESACKKDGDKWDARKNAEVVAKEMLDRVCEPKDAQIKLEILEADKFISYFAARIGTQMKTPAAATMATILANQLFPATIDNQQRLVIGCRQKNAHIELSQVKDGVVADHYFWIRFLDSDLLDDYRVKDANARRSKVLKGLLALMCNKNVKVKEGFKTNASLVQALKAAADEIGTNF